MRQEQGGAWDPRAGQEEEGEGLGQPGQAGTAAALVPPCPAQSLRAGTKITSATRAVSLQENDWCSFSDLPLPAWFNTSPAKPYVSPAHFITYLTSVQGPGRKMLSWKAQPYFPAISIGLMKIATLSYRAAPFLAPGHHGRRKDTGEDI